MKRYKTICIDFDGTIHRYSRGWKGGELYDPPHEGAIEAIQTLSQNGYNVIIFTTRGHSEESIAEVRQWLKKYGMPSEKADSIVITNIKQPALAYIDDRAIRFTSWNDMSKYFV